MRTLAFLSFACSLAGCGGAAAEEPGLAECDPHSGDLAGIYGELSLAFDDEPDRALALDGDGSTDGTFSFSGACLVTPEGGNFRLTGPDDAAFSLAWSVPGGALASVEAQWSGATYSQPGCEPDDVVTAGGDVRMIFDCFLGEDGGVRVLIVGGQLRLCGCES